MNPDIPVENRCGACINWIAPKDLADQTELWWRMPRLIGVCTVNYLYGDPNYYCNTSHRARCGKFEASKGHWSITYS